jgi:Grx4 family monothiol glutaredoxin
MPVIEISSSEQLAQIQSDGTLKNVVFFWAAWHEPSRRGGQMQGSFSALSEKYAALSFLLVEAEQVSDVSEQFGVTVVPTFFSCVGSNIVERLEGASPSELATLVKKHVALDASSVTPSQTRTISGLSEEQRKQQLNQRLEKLIHVAPVMLFMKGSPTSPRCGFSRQIVELLQSQNIPFASFDILTDEEVRSGLKVYSDWPTYPQLYVKGNLIGGLDILKEMVANSSNIKEELGIQDLAVPPSPPSLEDRLKALISQAPVMLFMKGLPHAPKCGFSRTIVEILNNGGIEYSSFDILSDEEVRTGLKEYSDWPTYPQLYVNGTLIGGLDIVKEMSGGGNLKEQLGLV